MEGFLAQPCPPGASMRESVGLSLATPFLVCGGGLSDDSMRPARARHLLFEGAIPRLLRLYPVGLEAPYLEEDRKFFVHVCVASTPLVYLNPCPKKGSS
jgi:hypothetical protein